MGHARAGDTGRRRRGAGCRLVRQFRADRARGGARGRRPGARLRRRIRRAAHRDGVDPGRALGRRGRRVPDPRARRLRRPLGRPVGAPDRRGPLRVPGRRVDGRVDARAAAAARLAKDGCGDAGHRACDRGSGRAPARPHPRRPRRRARPARRVVRPRRMVAVEPPVGSRASEGSGAGAGCRWGCRTRTRPRGRFRGADAARVPARVGRTCRARSAGPLHTSCVREAPSRGSARDCPGADPARTRPAHPGMGGGAGDRPADRRQGARLRLLHSLRPAVQSRRRLELHPHRDRDAARVGRPHQGERGAWRGGAGGGCSVRATDARDAAPEPGRLRPSTGVAPGRHGAEHRLGAVLGTGCAARLRRAHRLHERSRSGRHRGAHGAGRHPRSSALRRGARAATPMATRPPTSC